MLKTETAHYVFHYNESSKAEQDIKEIKAYQEVCFERICSVLKVVPQFKLEYYLCDSPEELDTDFEEYVSHHELDAALEEEMRKLEE